MSSDLKLPLKGKIKGKIVLCGLIAFAAIAPAVADDEAAYYDSVGRPYTSTVYASAVPADVSYYRDDAYTTYVTPTDDNTDAAPAYVVDDPGRHAVYSTSDPDSSLDQTSEATSDAWTDADSNDPRYWGPPAERESQRIGEINDGEVNGVFEETYGATGYLQNVYNKPIETSSYDTEYSNGYWDNQPTQYSRL
jgi:hypothetical protein